MKNQFFILAFLQFFFCLQSLADRPPTSVTVDTTQTQNLKAWGEDAKQLIIRWHPRLHNLLPGNPSGLSQQIALIIQRADKGVGSTSGSRITLASSWLESHPDDWGLVIHELTHVVQSYPSGSPWWVTEGIADYIRWGIYEGKPLDWFPRPKEKQGYKKGYRVTAGFLLWLESGPAPGIVKRLNTAMRQGKYSDQIFQEQTERSVDQFWSEYVSLD